MAEFDERLTVYRAWHHERPTDKQTEVLQLYANGLNRAQVAEALGISQETVKSHIKHARTRLAAKNVTQAIAISIRNQFIQ